MLNEFSALKSVQNFRKGETLLKEGEAAGGVYCIRSGLAKTEIQNGQGQGLLRHLNGKGSMVGLRSLAGKNRQVLRITAIENMKTCRVSEEQFQGLVHKYPQFSRDVFQSLVSELYELEDQALSLVYHGVKKRVARLLLYISEVYHYSQDGPSIHIHLDRQELANLAGTTKEQVSKALSEFRQEKLINFRAKHFKFFNLEGLKNRVESP